MFAYFLLSYHTLLNFGVLLGGFELHIIQALFFLVFFSIFRRFLELSGEGMSDAHILGVIARFSTRSNFKSFFSLFAVFPDSLWNFLRGMVPI